MEGQLGPYRSLRTTAETNRNGRLELSFVPEGAENEFLATAIPVDAAHLTLVRELQIGGDPVYDSEPESLSPRRRSNAAFVSEVANLNWPIVPDDAPLLPGVRHRITFGLVDQDVAFTQGTLDVELLLRSDADPTTGTLAIDVVMYGALNDDAEIVAATDDAIEVWEAIYEDVGIHLDVSRRTLTGAPLPPPTDASAGDQWRTLAEEGPDGTIHLVLSPDDVPGVPGVVGVAGDIPGSLVPGPRSGIRLLPERVCGVDGVCDDADVQAYGELMAHEVGHYLGLFHPAEDSWDRWDAHTDTAECTTRQACEAALGTNIMFPYVVCRGADCPSQAELTPQQVASMHAYTGVD